ncbi:MAG: M50 family metallopeptidase, partial [Hyphococcus sp.]
MNLAGMTLESLTVLPITILAFITLLTVIVFFHEYGHFSVARLLGVRVDVFSIGFGKPLLRWTDRKGTEWRIAALPLGGYVKFFGDMNAASQAPTEATEKRPVTTQFPTPGHEEEVADGMTAAERAVCFHFKPVWARAAIVAAGPIANFVLAVAIFATSFMVLGRTTLEPVIGGVSPDSAAETAGFAPGDRVLSIDGRRIDRFDQLYDVVLLSGGESLTVLVDRQGETAEIVVTPRRVESMDRYGNQIDRWLLGVSADSGSYQYEKLGFVEAVAQGVREVGRILVVTVRFLGKIILGKEDATQLGGPIKMAQYAGQSAMSGFDESGYREPPGFLAMLKASLVDFIFLAAVVSVSIGFLNLLPIPVLDGGHLLYYAYEAVAGEPLGARAQAIGFRVGIVMLASLMIFVTWNDI